MTDKFDVLTRVGPGTPAGELFRQFWLPVAKSAEFEPDGDPIRLMVLGERLIGFRDTEGRMGIIDHRCPHRCASLFFGRNEEGGLRCPYHGWKYDVTGQCVEVPSEADNSSFCRNVTLTAYPLVKIGDVLWTYMGDPATQPPLPEFEFALVPPEQTYTSKRLQQCNWLQAFEGGIDSSHVTFLHSGGLKNDPLFKGAKGNEYNQNDTKPFFEVADSDGGLFVGARRNAEEGRYYWRITPWVMPSFTMVPPRGDHPIHGHFWIPIDDENCWVYSFDYHPVRALTAVERQAMIDGHGVHSENIPGSYRPVANRDNDYLMDREKQRTGEYYSGIKGIAIQDASLQESMGPIADRTKERLVPADAGIIKARQKLRKAAIALRDHGTTPPGVDPEHHRVRSAAVVLPQAEAFLDSCKDAVRVTPGMPIASV